MNAIKRIALFEEISFKNEMNKCNSLFDKKLFRNELNIV